MTFTRAIPLIILFTCVLKLTSAAVVNTKATPSTIDPFTCAGKVIGGYYADVYENCQMFHVCTIGENGETRDIVFRCLNGTVFDQETRVCERQEEVDCSQSESFYHLNNVLYGPGLIPDTAMDSLEGRTPTQQQVLDPSDALMGVVVIPSPDDAPQQPTSISTPLTTHGPTATEDTAASQTTTISSPPSPTPLLTNQSHEPDIAKAKPSSPPSNFPTRDKPSRTNSASPFTVTRTASSSSVSASARVHIETPFSRFSLRQGSDDAQTPALPAPHLRPSLLKLAAQAMTEKGHSQSRRTRSTSHSDDATTIQPPLPSLLTLPTSLLAKPPLIERPPTGYFRSRFIPRFRATLKQDRRQTQTQKFRDNVTPPTRTSTMDSESVCRGKTHALLLADPETQCRRFQTCIPQHYHSELTRSFVCLDEEFAFDQKSGKCIRREEVECSPKTPPFQISIVKAETLTVYTLGLCSFMEKGAFILDILSGCEQYIQCPLDYHTEVGVRRCPDGYLFSQRDQRCISASEVFCEKDAFALSKLVNLKSSGILQDNSYWDMKHPERVESSAKINSISDVPLFVVRRRRALTLGDENPRDSPSGALNDQAGIVHDHVSVIEAQSPGNVVESKEAFPRITLQPSARSTHGSDKHRVNHIDILKKERTNPSPVRPETSHKTTLNGATIEVSEIVAPNHTGIVTITSVVPKTVRQNGNGSRKTTRSPHNDISSVSPTVITNGKTKITLLSSEPSTRMEDMEETEIQKNTTLEEDSDVTIEEGKSMVTEETTVTPISSTDNETEIEEEEQITEDSLLMTQETTTIRLEETTVELDETEEGGQFETESSILFEETFGTEEPTLEVTTEMSTSTSNKEPLVSSTLSTTTVQTSKTTPTSTTTTTIPTSTTSTTTSTTTESTIELPADTNFTCKDKELQNFYPDIKNDCRLFHYCSPGFNEDEILDLTFECSGDTRFDVHTKKCQDMNIVVCGETEAKSSTTTTTTSTPLSSSSSPNTTPSPLTTTSSSTISAATDKTASKQVVPSTILPETETTQSPTWQERDEPETTLEPTSLSTSEMEDKDNSEPESTTTPEELSTLQDSLRTETVEMDAPETTTASDYIDSSPELSSIGNREVPTETSDQHSSELSTTELGNKETDSSTSPNKSSFIDQETTVSSETDTSTTEDPLIKDFNYENILEELSSTSPPSDSTTVPDIPDDNLNLITAGDELSLSSSTPETSICSGSRDPMTETPLPSESDILNNKSVTTGDVPT